MPLDTNHAGVATVGHVSWSPDYNAGRYVSAQEAGDSTFVNPSTYDRLMAPPTPANDNSRLPRIVGLTGYAGSGKSAVAATLVEQGYVHTKFAGPLKSMLRALYAHAGVPLKERERRIEGDLKQEADELLQWRTPRQAMQWLGTEWGRGFFGDDFWVDLWAAGLQPETKHVVDDCRFPNEVAAIRERGGRIVEVRRPGVDRANAHTSETLPTDPDFVLHSDGQHRLADRPPLASRHLAPARRLVFMNTD